MSAVIVVRNRIIEATLFDHKMDNVAKPFKGTIGDLIGAQHMIDEYKDGSAWSPTTYLIDSTRCAAGVCEVTLLVFDFDDITQQAFDLLKRQCDKFAYVLHSTFAHGAQGGGIYRVRLILVLTRSISPDEFDLIRPFVTKTLGAMDDNQSRDISRISYLPRCTKDRGDIAFITYHDGIELDVEEAMLQAMTVESKPSYNRLISRGQPSVGAHRYVQEAGRIEHLDLLGRLCGTLSELLAKLKSGSPLNHRERFRIGQVGIAIGLSDDQLVTLFRTRVDFSEGKCRYHLASLRRDHKRPSCQSMASDFGLCTGSCPAAMAARARSPVGLIAWDRPSDELLSKGPAADRATEAFLSSVSNDTGGSI